MQYCPECLKKQQEINRLTEQVECLRARLRYQERSIQEGPFGSSTPSSQRPFKESSLGERQAKKGGGKVGHKGCGRKGVAEGEADTRKTVAAGEVCPDCGGPLERKGFRARAVIDCTPVENRKILYDLERKRCPRCGKTVQARPPGVLPRMLYGNQLLSHVAMEHYLKGRTLGQLERESGVPCSALIDCLHKLARRFEKVPERLVEEYRTSHVKHADETGWRTDGGNGYAWLFCTERVSVFRFRKSRSASVARDVLGTEKLPGVLVVDRYGAYNKMPSAIQYCYAHLLRDVQDVEKNFPDNGEVRSFVAAFAPLLADAMGLRSRSIPDIAFKRKAAALQKEIHRVVHHKASHPAIQKIQGVFRAHSKRLYHWARDRGVPAENNFTERELRKLVIARRISFGSQSDRGANTREILMSMLHTLAKRTHDPKTAFKNALDRLALNPSLDPYHLLFASDTS